MRIVYIYNIRRLNMSSIKIVVLRVLQGDRFMRCNADRQARRWIGNNIRQKACVQTIKCRLLAEDYVAVIFLRLHKTQQISRKRQPEFLDRIYTLFISVVSFAM